MTDDRKRAMELLLAQYIADGMTEVAEDFAAGREWAVERSAITAIAAALRAAPEGFVLVPVEPTQEMLDMVCTADGFEPWTDKTMGDVYRTMLAARPQGGGR